MPCVMCNSVGGKIEVKGESVRPSSVNNLQVEAERETGLSHQPPEPFLTKYSLGPTGSLRFPLGHTKKMFKQIFFRKHLRGSSDRENKSKRIKKRKKKENTTGKRQENRLNEMQETGVSGRCQKHAEGSLSFLLTFEIDLSQPHARFHNPREGRDKKALAKGAEAIHSVSYETPRIDSAAETRSSNPNSIVSFLVRVSSKAFLTSVAILLSR